MEANAALRGRLANADWVSLTDPGDEDHPHAERAHTLAYKPKAASRWGGDVVARRALRQSSAAACGRGQRSPLSCAPSGSSAAGIQARPWRYAPHVAADNLGLVMRAVLGAGTPRELRPAALVA